MKGLPLLLTAMSGSLGGLTFAHGIGGAYVRERANPTQPNTPAQTIIKGIFGQLSTAWRSDLSATQRDDWDLYADATPLLDRLGQSFIPTGLNMYIRGNTGLLQGEFTRVDLGPVTPGLPTFTAPAAQSIESTTNVAQITFTVGDAWVDLDENFLFIYASRGQGSSINFFKGPYQLAGVIEGDAITAPTSPAAITIPFGVKDGQKVFFRATLIDAEGRKGQDVFFEGVVSTA